MNTATESTKPKKMKGVGLSRGVALGTAYWIESQQPAFFRIRIAPDEVGPELDRFHKAIEKSREQYLCDKRKFETAVGGEHSYIFDVHILMLEDRKLLDDVENRIRVNHESPERALRFVADRLSKAYYSLEDPFFRDRGSDLEEVVDRILTNLLELDADQDRIPDEDLILVGDRIGLSVLARFPLDRIKGLLLKKTGKNSHVAIIARSYRIPLVSGIEDLKDQVQTGEVLKLDGNEGWVWIYGGGEYPGEVDIVKIEEVEVNHSGPCVLKDQRRIYLYGNTEFSTEVTPSLEFGAEGIGLFRTEFLYMKHGGFGLDEEKHYAVYRSLAENLGSRIAAVRTLDISEESGTRKRQGAGEESAALGLRGIRFSLRRPEMFKAQIRAILRASDFGNLRIVLPMVTSVDEILAAREIIQQIHASLGRPGKCEVPLGALIEVPSAVLTLESIASVSDFLAVGTNDLIQYTLAVGRLNEDVSDLYNPLHPAVLKSLQRIAEVGSVMNRDVFLCGEMAAHPVFSAVLVGLGFQNLSMNAIAIPQIKRTLRSFHFSELQDLANRILSVTKLAEIDPIVEEAFRGVRS